MATRTDDYTDDSTDVSADSQVEDATSLVEDATFPDPKIVSVFSQTTYRWVVDEDGNDRADISYGFYGESPDYTEEDEDFADTTFDPLTTEQRDAVRSALQAWANVANIDLQEVSDEIMADSVKPVIAVGGITQESDTYGWAYLPGSGDLAGDFWFNNGLPDNADLLPGGDGYETIVHELGHALGLSHPFDEDSMSPLEEGTEETLQFSVMSYTNHPTYPDTWPSAPMVWDVAAIQTLYGANLRFHAGNDSYTWATDARFVSTIWDGGGSADWIRGANQTTAVSINLNPGAFSSIGRGGSADEPEAARNNLGIAWGVTIENASGGRSHDTLVGNTVANRLEGNAGNDLLQGGAGNDVLVGGAGTDTAVYTGSRSSYRFTRQSNGSVVVTGPQGRDTLTTIEKVKFGAASPVALSGLLGTRSTAGAMTTALRQVTASAPLASTASATTQSAPLLHHGLLAAMG
ncbi:MAG TPA: M10 family metallopeptidase [Azospirillaceae bacterium]|nr:M10 family metallopeptidase [Azospirillaceae bacterium]